MTLKILIEKYKSSYILKQDTFLSLKNLYKTSGWIGQKSKFLIQDGQPEEPQHYIIKP